MKIAMPYQDGVLLEHFGRAKEFIIYIVSELDPVTSEVIAPEDLSHAAVARVLKEHGVDVVLCGSIGEHARQAVEGEHMLVFSGITGAAAYPQDLVAKMKATGAKVDALDCLALAEQAGSAKAVNIVLMGRLSHYFDLPEEAWQKSLEDLVPAIFLELIKMAFQLGMNA